MEPARTPENALRKSYFTLLYLWTLKLLEYTRGGRWRPACFLNLLIQVIQVDLQNIMGGTSTRFHKYLITKNPDC